MKLSYACVMVAIGLVAGCSGSDDEGGSGGSTSTQGTGTTTGTGTSTNPGGDELSGEVSADLTLSGEIRLTATATVKAGVTLTLSAGTTIAASDGAALIIDGALVGEGTEAAPVVMRSAGSGGPGSWVGLKAAQGGDVSLTYAEVHDAATGFTADPGSTFAIDHILIDTSSSLVALSSNGTLGHGVLHGLDADQSGQPVLIDSASPTISDTLIDQSNTGVDNVVVNGASSGPVFDHVEITDCHCAFHFNQGSGIQITGAYLHDNEYGIMAVGALETSVQDSNFEGNTVNIGVCAGGSIQATGVYFDGTAYDQSCNGQGNTSPAGAPIAGVGPRP